MKHVNQRLQENRADILLVGIGGAGGNILNYMAETGRLPDWADTLYLNTDLNSLCMAKGKRTIQLGEKLCCGRGSWADPKLGEAAMRETKEKVCSTVMRYDHVILIAGLGGGTGAGGTPILAQWLREMQIPHKIVVQTTYHFEGIKKARQAQDVLEQLRYAGECVRVVTGLEIQELANTKGVKRSLSNYLELADQAVAERIEEILAGMRAVSAETD